jgi:hypothetical protein
MAVKQAASKTDMLLSAFIATPSSVKRWDIGAPGFTYRLLKV